MKNYKYIAIFTLFLPVLTFAIVSQNFKTQVSVEQDSNLETLGKYQQEKIDQNTEVWVYEMPDGEQGYQIIERIGSVITSTGYGPLAKERTFVFDTDEK